MINTWRRREMRLNPIRSGQLGGACSRGGRLGVAVEALKVLEHHLGRRLALRRGEQRR
jgi:hypothetical protein